VPSSCALLSCWPDGLNQKTIAHGDRSEKWLSIILVFMSPHDELAWEVADLTLSEGPLKVGDWPRPAWVSVDGSVVRYGLADREARGPGGSIWRFATVEERAEAMLRGFVRLGDVPETRFPARLEAFARRWGVLGLCRHGMPATHPITAEMLPLETPCGLWMTPTGTEPVSLWREYARQARAVLDVATALVAEEVPATESEPRLPSRAASEGDAAAWSIALREFPPGSTAPPVLGDQLQGPDRVTQRRWLLDRAIARWTNVAGIQLVPDFDGAQPVRLGVRSLFGALAVQLLFAVVRAPFTRSCAGCGRFFHPSRRPRGQEKSWCPTCRKKRKDHAAASARFQAREAADPNRAKLARGRRVHLG
jgi:hypothetical protein